MLLVADCMSAALGATASSSGWLPVLDACVAAAVVTTVPPDRSAAVSTTFWPLGSYAMLHVLNSAAHVLP